ncbi:MAG: MerR family transcriptional regulator [Acidobacteriota bacterium]
MTSPKPASLGPRELARLTGVSTDTLRHYEKRGLLARAPRTRSGYRRYSPEAASRVLLIQRALVVGFSLGELTTVLAERDKGGAPCRSVRALVGKRLEELDRRLHELTALKAELATIVADWDQQLARTPAGARAYLLDTLAGRPPIDAARQRRVSSRRVRPASRGPS